MQGSRNAFYIDRDYKIKKSYEKSKRQKCKEKECVKCQYNRICEDKEIEDENEN